MSKWCDSNWHDLLTTLTTVTSVSCIKHHTPIIQGIMQKNYPGPYTVCLTVDTVNQKVVGHLEFESLENEIEWKLKYV